MNGASRFERRTAVRLAGMLVALLAVAATASPAGAATPALPSSDSFYTYSGSTPLAQIAPGTVLATRPMQLSASGASTLFTGEQVLYRAEVSNGAILSGLR